MGLEYKLFIIWGHLAAEEIYPAVGRFVHTRGPSGGLLHMNESRIHNDFHKESCKIWMKPQLVQKDIGSKKNKALQPRGTE